MGSFFLLLFISFIFFVSFRVFRGQRNCYDRTALIASHLFYPKNLFFFILNIEKYIYIY